MVYLFGSVIIKIVNVKLTSGRGQILPDQFVVADDPDRQLNGQDDRPQECRNENLRASRMQPQAGRLCGWQPLQEQHKVLIPFNILS